jgi:hypothetical protein
MGRKHVDLPPETRQVDRQIAHERRAMVVGMKRPCRGYDQEPGASHALIASRHPKAPT